MSIVVWPFAMTSIGSKLLAEKLDVWRVYPNRKYRYKPGDLVVNWGNSKFPEWYVPGMKLLNNPAKVRAAIDKVKCFQILEKARVPIPQWTCNLIPELMYEADIWLARTLTKANEGRGIVLFKRGDAIPKAKLYTKHLRHKHEFRVHVFNGRAVDVQEKRRRRGVQINALIRSWDNGWVFCRDNVNAPDGVKKAAVDAVKALKLDFGAVDVAYREKEQQAFVLEVNTAPGLEGYTIEAYAREVQNALQGM